jgi:endonuclease G
MKAIFTLLAAVFFLNLNAQEIDSKINQTQTQISEHEKQIIELRKNLTKLKLEKIQTDIKTKMIPSLAAGEVVTHHSAMALCYSDKHEQAKWVAHIIVPDIITGKLNRTNDFRPDSLIAGGSADKGDYWDTGYDRGHLAPSADFRWNLKAMSESYFYSNMSPQRPELNRESWAELENLMREYVLAHNEPLYMYTGPILRDGLPTIGKTTKVSIPEKYYKIAYDITGDTVTAIAFVYDNAACPNPTLSYAVPIDQVETLTGIDFFPTLPDDLEAKLEASFTPELWQIGKEKGNVLPIHRNHLPEGNINSIMAQSYYDKKATVCGTVVSITESKAGNIFINFDQKFPDQLFWATVWQSERVNFSYNIEETLINQRICVSGVVKEKYGKPSMSISNEKAIIFMDSADSIEK